MSMNDDLTQEERDQLLLIELFGTWDNYNSTFVRNLARGRAEARAERDAVLARLLEYSDVPGKKFVPGLDGAWEVRLLDNCEYHAIPARFTHTDPTRTQYYEHFENADREAERLNKALEGH